MPFDASPSTPVSGDTRSSRDEADDLACDWCGESVPREMVLTLRRDDDDRVIVLCAACERGAD